MLESLLDRLFLTWTDVSITKLFTVAAHLITCLTKEKSGNKVKRDGDGITIHITAYNGGSI